MQHERIEILGVPVDRLDWRETLAVVESGLSSLGPARAVVAVNPEKVIRAQHDARLLADLRRSDLLIPDGIGVVVAARLLGLGRMERVPGSELMPRICEIAARRGVGVYLFGARPEINEKAAAALRGRYPGLIIAGRQHGYVAESDMKGVVESINASGAAVLFLALGSPRQEIWMGRYLPQLRVRICQGVGGTFDVIAGAVKRAPRAFIRLHLEWLYRLCSDPRRLLRQTALPKFALRVLSAWVTRTAHS
jgi:N-acetylglucosaminyldiphosphoundecaprenol N-acetyl-beta-D-mannosaminyltransferase